MDRREFLGSASCAAVLAAWGRPEFAARRFARPLADEPWGRIEKVGEGVWALISTPLVQHADARRTLCNGGIVAGRSGVAIVEGLASNLGATWMTEQAKQLTGRLPTHVVLTHYHGDHSGGLAGYRANGAAPAYVTTELTRAQIRAQPILDELARAELVTPDKKARVDLGRLKLELTPRSGHTSSDVTVSVD